MASVLFADRQGGPYLGVFYAQAKMKPLSGYTLKEDTARTYGGYAGAFINPHLSVEVEYVDSFSFTKEDGKAFSLKLYDVNTQAHYPFYDDMFDVFAKFGVGFAYKGADSGFAMAYGVGGVYRVNRWLSVKGMYEQFSIGIDENNDNSADKTMKVPLLYGAIEVQF